MWLCASHRVKIHITGYHVEATFVLSAFAVKKNSSNLLSSQYEKYKQRICVGNVEVLIKAKFSEPRKQIWWINNNVHESLVCTEEMKTDHGAMRTLWCYSNAWSYPPILFSILFPLQSPSHSALIACIWFLSLLLQKEKPSRWLLPLVFHFKMHYSQQFCWDTTSKYTQEARRFNQQSNI